MPKIIMVDLDGVLNTYNGIYDEKYIAPIKDGAKDFLKKLSDDFKIIIFTPRNKKLVLKWFEENEILDYISDISDVKNPKASIYIDDRGLNFNGDYEKTLEQIYKFKPYWK